ncbi:hypothetical protein ACWEOE_16360 [Amycolatopsis sp. NPDC004368]
MTADEKQLDEQLDEVRHAISEAKDAAQEVRDSRPDPMSSGTADSADQQEDSTMSDPEKRDGRDAYGDTPEEERETIRGEQGTSRDPHDDTDPQSGS